MCNTQKPLEWNTNGVTRGPLLRTFLDILEKGKVKRRRLNYEDRDKNMLSHNYLKKELKKVSIFFFTEKSDIRGCRDRLCSLLCHAILCCSQTTLGMKFTDLFLWKLQIKDSPDALLWLLQLRMEKPTSIVKLGMTRR